MFRKIATIEPADALCILSTALATFHILDALEATWGGPIVTSNLAILWALMGAVSVPDAIPGLGALAKINPDGR